MSHARTQSTSTWRLGLRLAASIHHSIYPPRKKSICECPRYRTARSTSLTRCASLLVPSPHSQTPLSSSKARRRTPSEYASTIPQKTSSCVRATIVRRQKTASSMAFRSLLSAGTLPRSVDTNRCVPITYPTLSLIIVTALSRDSHSSSIPRIVLYPRRKAWSRSTRTRRPHA